MSRRALLGVGVIIVAVLAIGGPLIATFSDKQKQEPKAPPLDSASASASRFLDRYTEPDGRVVRRDQGGDSVSEGQAYAMLIAAGIGDHARFDSVWNWTKANLVQPSGMLAWRWADGKVVDAQPASDADMDAARALSVAARRFNDPTYANDAKTLAKAIADNVVVYPADGKPIIVAGPWARTAPYVTNPSYHSPRTEQELATLTGDTRWTSLERHERVLTDTLIGTGSKKTTLPPDWATVDAQGDIKASGPPSDLGGQPKYSYDAVRVPVRLAESCEPADRDQAKRLWTVLSRSQDSRASAGMALDGSVIDHNKTTVGAVAAAAGAHASGDDNESLRQLDLADHLDDARHTYYGGAWAALGRIMLTTNWLGAC